MNDKTAFVPLLCAAMMTLVAGCTWVKPTSGGADVQLADASQVADCQRLGKVNVSVKDRIGRINRKVSKVESELGTLARNEGAVMGGNTVAAESEIADGRQEFAVYDCP